VVDRPELRSVRRLRSRGRGDLLELDEVERRLRPFQRRYVGVRPVPLDHVVGTDGKVGAFTRRFEPRHASTRDRLRSLEEAFPDGGFPPIVAVKLGETYFVVDGHHRVALARRRGGEMIDADITEFVARAPLPPGADMVEVVLRELDDNVFAPATVPEARTRLGRDYRDAPGADLFLLLHRHPRESFPSCGCPPLDETIPSVVAAGGRKRRLRLPLRG
jgi:hypothetical protein